MLEKEYEMLDKVDENKYSPSKHFSSRLLPINQELNHGSERKHNYSGYTDEFSDAEMKIMMAANESLRLANSNLIKEEKFRQYDHYTHKKKFDYTS